jgi:hypothetical protein
MGTALFPFLALLPLLHVVEPPPVFRAEVNWVRADVEVLNGARQSAGWRRMISWCVTTASRSKSFV